MGAAAPVVAEATMNLHDHETEIDVTLRSLPRAWAPALAAFVKQTFRDQRRRAMNGRRNALTYSAAVEAGIRRAIGTLPPIAWTLGASNIAMQVQQWIERQGPAEFGLRRIPDIEIIRRVVCKVLEEQKNADSESLSVDGTDAVGTIAA
jgi:hypothetical protein